MVIGTAFEYGLPDLPACFSMNAVQASTMASRLHEIGEVELAEEIDGAIKSTSHYASM